MAEHTPGPWEYLKRDGVIVTHRPDIDVSHEIAWSDADYYLCAAAPDLLEACKEFVRKCECGEARSKRSYAQMKAAIAAAEGREEVSAQ